MILQGISPGTPTLGSGLPGRKGDPGPKGDKGDDGDAGSTGPANTLTPGSVTGGVSAAATITGTSPNQVLNLVLPKGDKGDKGDTGDQGLKGDTGDQGIQGVKGDGIQINERVAAYANLPTGKGPGDAGWSVFVQADGRLYIWSGTAWPSSGTGALIQGEQGIQGEPGDDGAPGEPGADGADGDQGIQGIQGLKGDQGDEGPSGASTWDDITDKPALVFASVAGTPMPLTLWVGSEEQFEDIEEKDTATVYLRF